MEEIYSRAWYIEEEEELGKYKRNSSRISEKNKYKDKKIRKFRYNRRKKL